MICFSLRVHQNRCPLSQTPSWFQEGRFAAGEEWREGLGGEVKEGERGNGEERGRWGSWGNSALLVEGIDVPAYRSCDFERTTKFTTTIRLRYDDVDE